MNADKVLEIIKNCSCYIDQDDSSAERFIIAPSHCLTVLKNILINFPNDVYIDIIFLVEDKIVMILYKHIGNRYIKFAVEIFGYKITLDIYEVEPNDIVLVDSFELSNSQEVLDALKSN